MNHDDIDFLLSHFDQHSLFPRKMMTLKSNGQFTVTSREEILIKCEQSNFEDCRINAYPEFTDYKGIVRQPPNFIFIDLDLANFSKLKEPKKALDKALRNTLNTLSTSFQARLQDTRCEQEHLYRRVQSNEKKQEIKPTVLWTGNGYHVYLPINALVLDQYDTFSQTNYPSLFSPTNDGKYASWSVSELFLKFCSVFFSAKKADPQHRPKFKTCLIRIPNTLNSKCLSKGLSESDAIVKIIQKWNGHRPHIQLVTKDFRRWLMQEELDERLKRKRITKTKSYSGSKSYSSSSTIIPWIEELLRTPLEDKRKYCLYKILVPYIKNIKMQDETTTVNVLKTWLKDCGAKKSLDFNPMQIIRKDLRYVKEYKPIGLQRLEKDNFELYDLLTKTNYLKLETEKLVSKE